MDQKDTSSTEIHTDDNAILLQWTAPIAPKVERGKKWYICAAIFVVLSGAFAAWTGAWSFLGLLVLISGTYLFIHKAEPVQKTMAVSKHGFMFSGKFIPWIECSGFWMLQGPGYVELHIERKSKFSQNIMLQTGPISVSDIRRVFSEFLPEFQEKKERIVDTIIRLTKI